MELAGKDEVLKRIELRNQNRDNQWLPIYRACYNNFYYCYENIDCKKIILKPGQYLSDVLEKEPE
jgi:hypothetical protein